MIRSYSTIFILFCLFIVPPALSAHHSWIVPSKGLNQIELGHGHLFPVSEQAMNPGPIKVNIKSQSGRFLTLSPQKEPNRLTVSYPASLNPLSAAYFIEEPVILTRTTKGVKRAPMNTLTGVIDSFRRHRSGVYQSTPGAPLPEAEQQVLLSCHRDQNRVILILRKGLQGMPDAEIEVCEPGQAEERKLGKTDAKGQFLFETRSAGLHLFSAELIQTISTAETKRNEYTATLAVKLE